MGNRKKHMGNINKIRNRKKHMGPIKRSVEQKEKFGEDSGKSVHRISRERKL